MTEKIRQGDMYQAGREFYTRQIDQLTEGLIPFVEGLECNDYDFLGLLDQLEDAKLKLMQLERRQEVLKQPAADPAGRYCQLIADSQ